MLNMRQLLYSKNYSQSFIVYRKQGTWISGEFVHDDPVPTITMLGVILPASALELMQLPEGDRSTATMCFYSDQEIFTTHQAIGGEPAGTSDEIEWHGDKYRVLSVNPYGDFGFWKAYAVYMEGD